MNCDDTRRWSQNRSQHTLIALLCRISATGPGVVFVAQERVDPDNRTVLELRVHGVNNTPPAAILDLPVDQVQEVLGDDLAGFWRPKRPDGAPGNAGTRGHVPDGITREAYSWGGLARRTPGGGMSAGGKVVAGLITIGWTLLLPFGLANVAFWTRRLDTAPDKSLGTGPGASLVRIFGLCLTSFLVVTLCDVSMDLVATQCYKPATAKHDAAMACSRLPGFLGGIAQVPLSVRLVVLSVVPVAVLLGLWALSSLSRSRYERAYGSAPHPTDATKSAGAERSGPLLADKDMWSRDTVVAHLTRVHLAVGFAIVSVCLTWPATFITRPSCVSRLLLAGPDCRSQPQVGAHERWIFLSVLIAAALVLLWATVLTFIRLRSLGPWPSVTLLVVSLIVLLAAEIVLLWKRPEIPAKRSLPGVDGLPTLLLVLMLALVIGAFFVRIATWPAWMAAVVVAGSLLLLTDKHDLSRWMAVALLALVGVTLAWLLMTKGDRRFHAWAGTGPGIFLGLALLAQGILSAALLLVIGDWLNGARGASQLVARHPEPKHSGTGPVLIAPLPYLLLGAVAVLALVVVLGGGLTALGASAIRPDKSAEREEGARASVDGARLVARVAHRAEKMVGLLALSGLLALVAATMALADGRLAGPGKHDAWLRPLDFTTPAVAVAGLALLGALVKGSGGAGRRPLGLVWDLVSFLPRSAHPFAPPCYAERAVPELTERVAWWLEQDGKIVEGQRRGGDKVVISAHSLGGVLTVAALMRQSLDDYGRQGRIRLLTYGSQLRAYFSRIFPELLGPTVLGTPPSRAATFRPGDPWWAEIHERQRPDDYRHSPDSVTHRLTRMNGRVVLWRSLWRRTDYLGFPVVSFLANPVDRRADELDESGYLLEVLTHSNYPRTPQYRRALQTLARFPVVPMDPSK